VKLNIVTEESDKIEMEVGEEGHTLLNLLQDSMHAHKDVKMAGYTKPHPLMDRSSLFITVKRGKDPKKTLIESAEHAKDRIADFITKFNAEVAKKKD
jgi:DNA-directed RNA polymerase subunit L